ncbi:hypothetical protein ACWDR1_32080 [Streptosporangium sandarakinum]
MRKRGLDTGAHLLAGGCVAVPVARGLRVCTDGRRIWWVVWDSQRRGEPLLAMHITVEGAADHLLKHLAVIERRQAAEVLHLPV